MTVHEFMTWAFWVWLFTVVWFVGAVMGYFVGHKLGFQEAKDLYKVEWK